MKEWWRPRHSPRQRTKAITHVTKPHGTHPSVMIGRIVDESRANRGRRGWRSGRGGELDLRRGKAARAQFLLLQFRAPPPSLPRSANIFIAALAGPMREGIVARNSPGRKNVWHGHMLSIRPDIGISVRNAQGQNASSRAKEKLRLCGGRTKPN